MNRFHVRQHAQRAKQRGLTIVELMIGLTVVGVFLAAAAYGYQLIFTSKAQNEMKYLDQAMECSRSITANQATYNGITTAVMANNNCFPNNLVVGKGTAGAIVNNTFGGAITTAAVNLNGTNDGLEFTSTNVPSDVCVNMLRLLTKPARVSVQANGAGAQTTVMALGAATPDLTQSTACGAGTFATIRFAVTKS
jgi:prepilin-type N-terminal cleavage/methylation domain-containing protein